MTPIFSSDRATNTTKALFSAGIWLARNWNNLLLVFVPIGILAPELGCGDSAIFVLNCFAIIPLADVLCRATDDASSFLGETTGALLNITMGNATELAILYVSAKLD